MFATEMSTHRIAWLIDLECAQPMNWLVAWSWFGISTGCLPSTLGAILALHQVLGRSRQRQQTQRLQFQELAKLQPQLAKALPAILACKPETLIFSEASWFKHGHESRTNNPESLHASFLKQVVSVFHVWVCPASFSWVGSPAYGWSSVICFEWLPVSAKSMSFLCQHQSAKFSHRSKNNQHPHTLYIAS